jgi:hypothetical protein
MSARGLAHRLPAKKRINCANPGFKRVQNISLCFPLPTPGVGTEDNQSGKQPRAKPRVNIYLIYRLKIFDLHHHDQKTNRPTFFATCRQR